MFEAFIKCPFICLWITGPQNVWFGVWRVLHITTGSKPDVVGGSNSVLSCAVFVKSGSFERGVTGTYQQGTGQGEGLLAVLGPRPTGPCPDPSEVKAVPRCALPFQGCLI